MEKFLVHFLHPYLQQHHETVNPAVHWSFSSDELRKLWKDIQADYDKVMTNFTKSGNHNSSLPNAAIIALRDQCVLETNEEDFDETDEDDVFGVEEGGFCNFTNKLTLYEDGIFGVEEGGFCTSTNSIAIVYLRLWLSERPGLVNFVLRQIRGQIQVDSMSTSAAVGVPRDN